MPQANVNVSKRDRNTLAGVNCANKASTDEGELVEYFLQTKETPLFQGDHVNLHIDQQWQCVDNS
jgi:hypothetical protein